MWLSARIKSCQKIPIEVFKSPNLVTLAVLPHIPYVAYVRVVIALVAKKFRDNFSEKLKTLAGFKLGLSE